jgi:hypothetical protein
MIGKPRVSSGQFTGSHASALVVLWDFRRESRPKGPTPMQKPYVESTNAEPIVIEGFEGEVIKITIEQLEDRTVPQSTAGFLD